ncbi:hypothetical protein H6G89_25215 [Oscillatoria sp. FACHB-1407]|uniref:hypothetical protein n=1 Tax=Oscillatoria sp. FACHB-1407 TaxID=2692847 RepID=UPI001685356D|nr:hypothetical protein [Oscillatoria sp. FACHB-1407]MBD2464308.1 hypothetical protein [Oscillatoria sp. FACHB-1407]
MPDLIFFAYSKKEIAFLFIWLITLIIPVIYGITNVYRGYRDLSLSIQEIDIDNDKQTSWKYRVKVYLLPVVLFTIFIFYTYLILYNADFAGNDYSQITLYTVRDKLYSMPIWERSGRFWPLGFQEFNFVSLFGKEPIIYFSVSILQLLVVLICLFLISWDFNPIQSTFMVLLLIATPSFVKVYFDLIYPERNIIFWLAIFVLSIQRWERSKPRFTLCVALIAAQFSLYYKEPVFILISSFSILRLALALLRERQNRNRINLYHFIRRQWMDFSLLILSFIFLLLYLVFILPSVETSYNAERNVNITELDVFVSYIKADPLLSILISVLFFRVIILSIRKRSINTFWDPLAIGAILYFLAYVKLRLNSWYYMAPVDFISILYIGWVVHKIIKHQRKRLALLIIGALACVIFFNNLSFSSAYILNLKKEWDGRVQLASFLRSYQPDEVADNTEIFFPSTRSYQVNEVAVYLDYKGVALLPENYHNLVISEQTNIPLKIITLKGETCIKRYGCYEAEELKSGNLVVIMPDQGRTVRDVLQNYEVGFNLLFHYQPEFSSIERLLLFLSNLRELSDKDIYVLVKN